MMHVSLSHRRPSASIRGNGPSVGFARRLALSLVVAVCAAVPALALERPTIWVQASDREAILQKIDDHEWAQQLFTELKKRADAAVVKHSADVDAYLRQLSFDGVSPKSGHPQLYIIENDRPRTPGSAARASLMNLLQEGVDCGVMYFLTGEEPYARLAADVAATYVRGVSAIEPTIAHNGGLLYPKDHLKEARIFGAQLPIVYDFAHPFLIAGGDAYNLATSKREPFPFDEAQRTFGIYVDRAINTGIVDCNWPVLESPSLVGNLLALESERDRERFLPYYLYRDTKNQDSLKTVAETYRKSGGSWPEPQGYAAGVGYLSTYLMTMLERRDPSLRLAEKYPEPPASLIRLESLRFPNADFPTLGDAPRFIEQDFETFEYAYHLAKIAGRSDEANIYGGLLLDGIAAGTYDRGELRPQTNRPTPYLVPLQLLWGEPQLEGDFSLEALPRTDNIDFAGLYLQRNASSEDFERHSLMAFAAAGHFIHAHATGLHAEFYGKGEVLGLRAGTGLYGSDLHENFYVLPASGNTVISNGATVGKGDWVNRGINQAELVSIEPASRAEAVSPDHSFSTMDFDDEHNTVARSQHRRTIAVVRTSPTTGYYVDVFRARSRGHREEFHDYIYRNVGEEMKVHATDASTLNFEPTPDRYPETPDRPSHPRYKNKYPGWQKFTEVKTTDPGTRGVVATFSASDFGDEPLLMRAHLPHVAERELTTALSPPAPSSEGAYRKIETPLLVLRQQGDAWDQPFATVLEPGIGEGDAGTIKSVETLTSKGVFSGLKIESEVDGERLVQHVLLLERGQVYEDAELGLHFSGHFAIVTVKGDGEAGSLYLGDGQKLTFGEHELTGGSGYLTWGD